MIIDTAAFPGLYRQRQRRKLPYFVAHPAKNCENLFFTSRGFGRIVKAPVVPFHHPPEISDTLGRRIRRP